MKLRMLKHPVIRGRKYLLQLVITCVTLILFPLILSLIFICNRSYSQLIATYQQHYEETAEQFSNQFSKGVSDIYLNSLLISSESRKKENDAAQLDIASLQQDGFYIYTATKVITEYGKSTSEIFGIYYYDIDLLITKNYSYSANSFAGSYLKISQNDEDRAELDHFLSLESRNIVFSPPQTEM